MVTAPHLIQVQAVQAIASTFSSGDSSVPDHDLIQQDCTPSSPPVDNPSPVCEMAKQLLQQLTSRMADIPATTPLADETHPLAIFSGASAGYGTLNFDD